MNKFDGVAVLRRAEIILGDGLPPEDSEHGRWCIWCACALAKGQLDAERETGVSVADLFEDLAFGLKERDEDAPLVQARIALRPWNEVDPKSMTREIAMDAVRRAINSQTTDSAP